jgi:hypothetical protein
LLHRRNIGLERPEGDRDGDDGSDEGGGDGEGKAGQRRNLLLHGRVPGFRPGDKGTVFCLYNTAEGVCYHVAMDKGDPTATTVILKAQEIEPDV